MALPSSSQGTLPTGNAGRSAFFSSVAGTPAAMVNETRRLQVSALPIEREPRQVFLPTGPGHYVVLDANAAEGLQLLHAAPVYLFAQRLGPRLVQQLVDEIEPRLH